jgi:site-specific DNA-methyltransferase (adenine-specific)
MNPGKLTQTMKEHLKLKNEPKKNPDKTERKKVLETVSHTIGKPKEYFFTETHSNNHLRLFLGDCFQGMKEFIEPASVDVVVTSPPYNIGVKYGKYNDKIPRERYLRWMNDWGRLIRRVLAPNGSLFLNIGSKPSDPWVPFDVAFQLREWLQLQNVIHWIKSIYVENDSYGKSVSMNVGHFKPINSKRFLNDAHEYVFHFTRDGNVSLDRLGIGIPYKDNSNVGRWKSAGKGVRCRGNNWYIPYATIQRRSTDRPHPASFPPELAEMCIKVHGLENTKLVLDPFLGIGNTAIACARLGKGMFGFEIDEEYLSIAKNRLLKNYGRDLDHPAEES